MELKLEAKTNNEKLVKKYLEDNASEELSLKINSGNKTLNGCWNYITEEAKKQAVDNCACIEDKEVYGWAIHYFEEDSIKENEIKRTPTKVETHSKSDIEAKPIEKKSTINDMQISLFEFEGENDKETDEDKE